MLFFMIIALIASLLISFILAPLGVFVISRRMSLMGDAISHALLPGIIVFVLFFGASPLSMMAGALATGLLIALLTPFLKRFSALNEDAAFAALTVSFLSLGVALSPLTGQGIELTHLLFGSMLTLDVENLIVLSGAAFLVIGFLALYGRLLMIDTFEPLYTKLKGKSFVSTLFLIVLVVGLVASFQAVGTLLAVGFMLLPALTARLWGKTIQRQLIIAPFIAFIACCIGLSLSFNFNLSASAAIMLAAASLYGLSLLFKGLR